MSRPFMKSDMIKIVVALLTILVVSCQKSPLEETMGTISLSFDQDFSEELLGGSQPSVRSVPAQTETVFAVELWKGERLISKVDDHRTIVDGLTVQTGECRVVADTGEDVLAAFDSPYYKGEANVLVKYQETTEANIICKLANTKLSFKFSEEFANAFSEYTITVTNSLGGSLTYSNLDGTIFMGETGMISKEGYFKSGGDLTWTLDLKNTDGAEYHGITDVCKAVAPRQHHVLTFSIDQPLEPLGAGYIKIKVDDSLNEKIFNAAIDLDNNKAPEIQTNPEFIPFPDMEIAAGSTSPKNFTIESTTGLKSVILSHSDMNLKLKGLPYHSEFIDAANLDQLAQMGIKAEAHHFGDSRMTIDVTDLFSTLEMGKYDMKLTAFDVFNHKTELALKFSIIINADADIVTVDPWAKFAVVSAKWFAADAPAGLTFMYKKVADLEWISLPLESIVLDTSTKSFSANLTGLAPSTEYMIKAVSAVDTDTREVNFTTEGASQIYNFSFDDWWLDGKVWYPNAQGNIPHVWDSANPAAASFIGSSTVPLESGGVKGKAVSMTSKYAVIAFAAGNIFTGNFDKINGKGAELNWGVGFADRPIALRGWYKYLPKAIDRVQGKYSNMKGQPDKCQILVMLTDWDKPFHINTTAGIFVDYANDPHIIASAKYESDETVPDFREFCLPLEYRCLDRTPKYVVIACCSSYLGDYFTGGEGSALWVDEFSFEYDIESLTDEQKAKVNYK